MALTVLFGALAAIALGVVSYVCWLWRAPRMPVPGSDGALDLDDTAIDLIVAIFNERRLLERKLMNLAQLDWPSPARLRFLIVDGGSTDGSAEIAAEWARHDSRFVTLSTTHPDKTAQLNAALRRTTAPWVVVTDADARLPRETLSQLGQAVRCDPSLAVLGTPVMAADAHPAEQIHCHLSNWLRSHEARRGSASIVVAPCYAFRRSLLTQLPADVLADDVYVAWYAASLGQRVGMAGPLVAELRTPRSIAELFRHKVRRGIGVLREVLRFLPQLHRMTPSMRPVFLCRAGLFLLVPPLIAGLLAGIIVAGAAGVFAPAVGLWLLMAVLLKRQTSLHKWAAGLMLPVLLVAAAGATLFAYPFVRPTACFQRLHERADEPT